MKYKGSCHCGRVRYDVEGEMGAVLECNCTHCSRKGYLLWFLPRKAMTLITPQSELSTYMFNKHVIAHQFCPKCGCAPFGFGKDKEGTDTVAINVRCLEGVDLTSIKRQPYDGRGK